MPFKFRIRVPLSLSVEWNRGFASTILRREIHGYNPDYSD